MRRADVDGLRRLDALISAVISLLCTLVMRRVSMLAPFPAERSKATLSARFFDEVNNLWRTSLLSLEGHADAPNEEGDLSWVVTLHDEGTAILAKDGDMPPVWSAADIEAQELLDARNELASLDGTSMDEASDRANRMIYGDGWTIRGTHSEAECCERLANELRTARLAGRRDQARLMKDAKHVEQAAAVGTIPPCAWDKCEADGTVTIMGDELPERNGSWCRHHATLLRAASIPGRAVPS